MRIILASLLALLAAAAFSPASAQNRFWLVNQSGQTIESAFVSPSRLDNWGPDILGQSVLPAGQQVHVTPSASDCVLDIRVRYQGGREETKMQVNACNLTRVVFGGGGGGAGATVRGGPGGAQPGGPGATTRAAGDPSFSFVNRSGATIRELYVSLSTDTNWGRDRLGDAVLEPGNDRWVDLPANRSCTVDIKVVYMNGREQERRGLETCSRTDLPWR
ncbi:Tat pathway signal protein [Roseomonas sp. GC11]|uniref:Tat pathway signal protein n=1 Tax=Roseomonas sp. GC11 TaxID=2950546 RepID=UPI00210D09D7|nr:Tat pathway signal protein [Roseomonas sp. GC11]MCQ4162294.1 Tat pathway signal protein [Roseomonas sp. GC11]